MSAEIAPVDQLKAAQQQLAEANLRNARLASETISLLIEEAAQEALLSKDPAEMAKVLNALQPIATHPEKQAAAKATAAAAGALLQIILDDNVPQVAPPKKPKPVTVDVEDAVEVAPAREPAQIQQDDNWGWAE